MSERRAKVARCRCCSPDMTETMSEDKTAPLAKGQGLSASPDCQRCHGTGIVGGHWLGDKWCDHMHTYSFCGCTRRDDQ